MTARSDGDLIATFERLRRSARARAQWQRCREAARVEQTGEPYRGAEAVGQMNLFAVRAEGQRRRRDAVRQRGQRA